MSAGSQPRGLPEIRRARPADRDELEAMHQVYLTLLEDLGLEVVPHALDDAWFTDPSRLFAYVAHSAEGPLGYMLVLGPAHAQAMGFEVDSYVHELFVRPEVRSSGIGHALFSHALRERTGTWSLEVLLTNTPASEFWARCLKDQPGLTSEVREPFRIYHFESI